MKYRILGMFATNGEGKLGPFIVNQTGTSHFHIVAETLSGKFGFIERLRWLFFPYLKTEGQSITRTGTGLIITLTICDGQAPEISGETKAQAERLVRFGRG